MRKLLVVVALLVVAAEADPHIGTTPIDPTTVVQGIITAQAAVCSTVALGDKLDDLPAGADELQRDVVRCQQLTHP